MMFTALAELPDRLIESGLSVVVADGWLAGQCTNEHEAFADHYLWTNPYSGVQSHDLPPFGYLVHHTAGTSATPPNHESSKANAWIGLWRDGKLYQDGDGTPTIYLASAGPCRISSGYGYKPAAWDYTFEDQRAPAHAQGPDGGTALNRYVFNVETVHAGDGGPIDVGVWEHVVGLGAVLTDMFGWEERTLGHTSWSQRKIDPKWSVGLPNDGADCIIDIQDAIAEWESEDVDYDLIREIVREEVEWVLGGPRITMPDQARAGNQGVVNSIWHATIKGDKAMDLQWDAAQPDDD